jgi:hypothetical protein
MMPTGFAIASFWSEERSQKAFGAGDYRPGWYLLDDDSVELDGSTAWEPLILEIDRAFFEDEIVAAFDSVATRSYTVLDSRGSVRRLSVASRFRRPLALAHRRRTQNFARGAQYALGRAGDGH